MTAFARFELGHVEQVSADRIGSDEVAWLADAIGLPDWPAGHEFALLCGTRDGEPWTYLCADTAYAAMLTDAVAAGVGAVLSPEVAAEKCPAGRAGWPATWLGL